MTAKYRKPWPLIAMTALVCMMGCAVSQEPESGPSPAPSISRPAETEANPQMDYPPPDPAASTATPVAAATNAGGGQAEPRRISEARYVTLDSWSPDGRWIAEWVDMTTPSPDIPGADDVTLRFVEVASARSCLHAEVTQPEGTDGMYSVRWKDDGLVSIVGLQGIPCQGAFGGIPSPTLDPEPEVLGGPRSPNGLFEVTTEVRSDHAAESAEPTEHMVTTLIRRSDDRVIARVPWQRRSYGQDPIGEWLPDGSFLIARTHDRGPLQILPDGTVLRVGPDVLNLADDDPSDLQRQVAFAIIGEDPAYHLALWSWKHGLLLYHPESQEVEDLGSIQWRSDSGDLEPAGIENPWWEEPWPEGWMVMVGKVYAGFARKPDPPQGPWLRLPGNIQGNRWSPDGSRFAASSGFGDPSKLEIVTFPDLSPVAQYSLPWLDRILWSPDGRRVVVSSNSGTVGATFVIDVAGR